MTRENAASKAKRLLQEGRVMVRAANGSSVDALVRGDSASLRHVCYEFGNWSCDCAYRGDCSHIRAVRLVTLTDQQEDRT